MIEHNQAVALWNRCLPFIKDNVNATAFKHGLSLSYL